MLHKMLCKVGECVRAFVSVCVWVCGIWLFIAMRCWQMPLCCLRFPLVRNTPPARLSQPPFVPHCPCPSANALSCTSCSRRELTEMQHKQQRPEKPLTHAPNGQFGQHFGRLAAQTVWADYRHYFWYIVYQKIKWKNQSLSLILKRFPRAYYQVLNGAQNRLGKKKEIFN